MKRYDCHISKNEPQKPPHLRRAKYSQRILSEKSAEEIAQEIKESLQQNQAQPAEQAGANQEEVEVEVVALAGEALSAQELEELETIREANEKELLMLIGSYLPMSKKPNIIGLQGELIAEQENKHGRAFFYRLKFNGELLGLATAEVGTGLRQFKIHATSQEAISKLTMQLMGITAQTHLDPGKILDKESLEVLRGTLAEKTIQRKKEDTPEVRKALANEEHKAKAAREGTDTNTSSEQRATEQQEEISLPLPK